MHSVQGLSIGIFVRARRMLSENAGACVKIACLDDAQGLPDEMMVPDVDCEDCYVRDQVWLPCD